jgi:Putative death-receptor fusion protein (DUF2428)
MGKKNKIAEAICIPHDGPLHFILHDKERSWENCLNMYEGKDQGYDGDETCDDKGIRAAVNILQENQTPLLIQELWRILLNSSNNSEQLQGLRSFRTNTLQNLNSMDETTKFALIGTYRILLELLLSYKTNQATRRATQANLDILHSKLEFRTSLSITRDVVSHIWDEEIWFNPLQSLLEALTYDHSNHIILGSNKFIQESLSLIWKKCQSILSFLDQNSFSAIENNLLASMDSTQPQTELTADIAVTLKLLLTSLMQKEGFHFTEEMKLTLKYILSFLWKAISCSLMKADELSKLGVAYGQTLIVTWIDTSEEALRRSIAQRTREIAEDNNLPSLNSLHAIQGIAVYIPDELLFFLPTSLLEDPFAPYFLKQCTQAIDPPTRLAALRSLQTLINRCCYFIERNRSQALASFEYLEKLSQQSLSVVMDAWENPPGRQVSGAIPGLFNSIITFIELMHPKQDKAASAIQSLLSRVLLQPVNRKGRYIALEALLPIVGAKVLIGNSDNLVIALVDGVGDRAHTAGNIAALLGKILSKRREEMNEEYGITLDQHELMNRKQRLRQEKLTPGHASLQSQRMSQLLPEWIALWAPAFTRGLLSKSHVRRQQVSSFCIPLLITMVGGSSRRYHASFALSELLKQLEVEFEQRRTFGSILSQVHSHDTETVADIFLWAKLELARQASAQKLLCSISPCHELISSLNQMLPEAVLRDSLLHRSDRIRIAAFSAIESLVSIYATLEEKSKAISWELKIWKAALPYSLKSGGKDFAKSLLQYLETFLNRLAGMECRDQEEGSQQTSQYCTFISGFLINTILLKQTAYPGAVAEKQQVAIFLLRSLINIVHQSEILPIGDSGSLQDSNSHIHSRDTASLMCITKHLVSNEVLFTVISLCHSDWDGIRSEAFSSLLSLIEISHKQRLPLPEAFYDDEFYRRGIQMSSSPRQREAETGAMILAIAACVKNESEQNSYLIKLCSLLRDRVSNMRKCLEAIFQEGDDSQRVTEIGLNFPLAHGLLQASRLIIEATNCISKNAVSKVNILNLIDISMESIETSLSVVADLKADASMNGAEDRNESSFTSNPNFQLNVNTGAIGANASFSSIHVHDVDLAKRYANQRVVIGTWLLTRDACATLASLIIHKGSCVPHSTVRRAGQLLITTMTSLKHQGAAFAAQKALQQVAAHCASRHAVLELRELPIQWSERLMCEISKDDKVRDSTLRRSTGYALGFLALMRSEITLKVFPKQLCPSILASLVTLSLPSRSILHQQLKDFKLHCPDSAEFLFSDLLNSFLRKRPVRCNEDSISRVHALNILRHIILDAPLAFEVAPFVGDCIVSSILGYTDTCWSVRNSATMVFSASMLRVIDADKNALHQAEASSNSITAGEFFRRYPQVKGFLLAVLKQGWHHFQEAAFLNSHSPIYLILLLFARFQPVRRSGDETASVLDEFVNPIKGYLSHKECKIRLMAGRALSNLAGNDPFKMSYNKRLLKILLKQLSSPLLNWNSVHGALIGIFEVLKTVEFQSAVKETGFSSAISGFFKVEQNLEPSCHAIALEIQGYFIMLSCDHYEKNCLIGRCIKIIQHFEENEMNANPGDTTLLTTAGKVASELLSASDWSDVDVWMNNLGLLKTILSCEILDVRLIATKTFKKSLYQKIDHLLAADLEQLTKITVLEKVADTIMDSLLLELARKSSAKSFGSHTPTVRRLSRCLLECLYALNANGVLSFPAQDLWQVASLITKTACHHKLQFDDTVTRNAAEIMGFCIGLIGKNIDESKCVTFTLFLEKLNHPLVPWQNRYSAACALKSSALLVIPKHTSFSSSLYREYWKMLQDSDADVRAMASGAIKETKESVSATSLLALERSFHSMPCAFGNDALASLATRYHGLENRLESVMSSTFLSNRDPTTAATIVSNPIRKIFEEEEANSYEESLLACHIAIHSLVSKENVSILDESSCSSLLHIGVNVLNFLNTQYTSGKSQHFLCDIARQNEIFPDVHGLFVSCIGVIYLTGHRHNSIQLLAQTLVSECTSSLHPCILDTLNLLASSKKGDKNTYNNLLKVCFLAPGIQEQK